MTIDLNQAELAIMAPADITKVYEGLKAMGAKRVRLEADWQMIESTPGQYNWSTVDAAVAPATQYGITPLIEISGGTHAPSWATPENYATFCAALAKRYGPLAYEIWNEPNNWAFYNALDPVGYTAYLKAAYPAIKAVQPNATVLTAGIMVALTWLFTKNAVDWLTAMYAAGAKGYFDAVAFHPYCGNPYTGAPLEPADAVLGIAQSDAIYAVMQANGDGDKSVWWTEFGYSTGTNQVTEAQQAQYLTEQVALGLKRSYVGPMLAFSYRNMANDNGLDTSMGVVNFDWTPKKSWGAIHDLNNSTTGVLMALTDAEQQELLTTARNNKAALATILGVVEDNQIQLRGPGLTGWPQLGDEPAGHRTLVDAFAAVLRKLGVVPS